MKSRPLKLAVLTIATCCMLASPASATLLLYEDFNYAAGSNLTGQNGGTGNWNGSSWATVESTYTLADPTNNLTYPDLPTSGNSIVDITNSRGNSRTWDTTGLLGDGASLWFSVLVDQSTTSIGSDLRFNIVGAGSLDAGAGLYLQDTGAGSTIFARIGGTSSATSLAGPAQGETMLLVGRVDFSSISGQDTVTLWLDPSFETIPTTGGVSVQGNISTGSNVLVRSGANWQGSVDEIRVGTTFDDVVAVPEPSTAAMLGLGTFGLLGLIRRRRQGCS